MKPTPITPREMILSQVPGYLSLWVNHKNKQAAFNLLALYGGIKRLPAILQPNTVEQDLINCVESQYRELLKAGMREHKPSDWDKWYAQLEKLETLVTEPATTDSEMDNIHLLADALFNELDYAQLAAWTAKQLNNEVFTELEHDLLDAEISFADCVHLFVSLADECKAIWMEVMNNPNFSNPRKICNLELLDTMCKHDRIMDYVDAQKEQ